jgi:hypothetical protein
VQVSNLLYRRLPVGSAWKQLARPNTRGVCGLEIRDTADWKSALQRQSALPDVAQVSNLLYRRLPAGSAWKQPVRPDVRDVCGLEIRDTADWKSALQRQSALPDVAQVSNLLYRRLPVGSAWKQPARPNARGGCGLEIRDTADWKSALQRQSALPDVAQVSNLLYRRLPVGSAWKEPVRPNARGVCGLEIRDTADWKSALRRQSALRMWFGPSRKRRSS